VPSIPTLLGLALAAAPDETVFWSGAGISVDAPTSGPVGNALADRTLDNAFAPLTATTIADYYRKLTLPRQRPRLETLLDVAFRVHGQAFLDDLLSDLATATPNALHGFFASHLALGGRHITANFDTCIERSAASGTPVDVVHFHGSFGGAPLGATLSRIERGFPRDAHEQLERTLINSSARLVVFVGYGGLDFFDVDPFLRRLPAESLRGCTVIWVNHSGAPPHLVPPTRRQLQWLTAVGAWTIEINARTRDVLQELANHWGLTISDPPGSAAGWRPTLVAQPGDKELATLELYALMNLHMEVHARVRAPRTARESELLAQTLWAEGRYRDAGDAWQRARAAGSDSARRERRAAVFWIRGEFRKARRELLAALADRSTPLEERLILAELLARVLVHMRRFPDSRLVPSKRIRRLAIDELRDPDDLVAAGNPLGTHLRVRVASARAALGASNFDDADAVVSFGEYEALGGQLNYRHAGLRRRLARGRVDPLEMHELRDHFDLIGAYGDAARTTLLAGVGIFSCSEVIAAARALDVSCWHRVRLVGVSLFASVRRGLGLFSRPR
jgi:hypothetical protein